MLLSGNRSHIQTKEKIDGVCWSHITHNRFHKEKKQDFTLFRLIRELCNTISLSSF